MKKTPTEFEKNQDFFSLYRVPVNANWQTRARVTKHFSAPDTATDGWHIGCKDDLGHQRFRNLNEFCRTYGTTPPVGLPLCLAEKVVVQAALTGKSVSQVAAAEAAAQLSLGERVYNFLLGITGQTTLGKEFVASHPSCWGK